MSVRELTGYQSIRNFEFENESLSELLVEVALFAKEQELAFKEINFMHGYVDNVEGLPVHQIRLYLQK